MIRTGIVTLALMLSVAHAGNRCSEPADCAFINQSRGVMHQWKLTIDALKAEQKRVSEDAERARSLPTTAARLQMTSDCAAQMELLNRLFDRIPKGTDFTGLKEGE